MLIYCAMLFLCNSCKADVPGLVQSQLRAVCACLVLQAHRCTTNHVQHFSRSKMEPREGVNIFTSFGYYLHWLQNITWEKIRSRNTIYCTAFYQMGCGVKQQQTKKQPRETDMAAELQNISQCADQLMSIIKQYCGTNCNTMNNTRFSLNSVRISSCCKLLGRGEKGREEQTNVKNMQSTNIRLDLESCKLFYDYYKVDILSFKWRYWDLS